MFSQQIPIKLPRGVNGTQPDLALAYSPGQGNGMVGMGWQLTGLPVVTRVNYGNGIRCAGGDTYAHSQLGVLVRQADGTYRSKNESFVKLVPWGTCGDGPCSWTAHHPSGVKSYYGLAPNSRLLVQGSTCVRTWGLAQVVDLFGNFYDVAYQNDAANGLIYPSLVTYNRALNIAASGNRTVEFQYETRTDTEPGYYQSAFQQMNQRLKWIIVKSGGVPVRKYRLDYECGDTTAVGCPGTLTGRSRLKAVEEYGGDGPSTLPAETFRWQEDDALVPGNSYTPYAGSASLALPTSAALVWYMNYLPNGFDAGTRMADLNGDGLPDVIYALATDLTGYTRSGAYLNGPNGWTQSVAYAPPWSPTRVAFAGLDEVRAKAWDIGLRLIDLNGDGKPDLLFGYYDGQNHLMAWLNNGGNCSTTACAWTPAPAYAPPLVFTGRDATYLNGFDNGVRLADLDGNGKPDLILSTQAEGTTYRNAWFNTGGNCSTTGCAWTPAPSYAPPAGYYFARRHSTQGASWAGGLQLLDADGDGRVDLLFGALGNQSFSGCWMASDRAAWLNTGSGWVASANYAPPVDFVGLDDGGRWDYGVQFPDLNGDGKPDIVIAFGGVLSVGWGCGPLSYETRGAWLSTGKGWVSAPNYTPPTTLADRNDWNPWGWSDGVQFADLNGDGKPDMVQAMYSAGNYIRAAWMNSGGAWVAAAASYYPPPNTSFGGRDSTYKPFLDGLQLVDLNGDGRPDYVYATGGLATSWVVTWASTPLTPDLLSTVKNGVGGAVMATYQPAPQVPGAIAPSSTAPGIPNTAPRQLVTRVTTDDGRGGSSSTRYDYYDGRVVPGSIPDQRDLGFRYTTIVDERTGQSSRTWYNQNPGYEGNVSLTSSYASNGLLMGYTNYGHDLVYPSAGTQLVREYGRVACSYEFGTFASCQQTYTSYDGFGNATVKAQYADGLPTVEVTTSYANDTANWILGRITGIKTTSGSTTFSEVVNTWTGNALTEKREWLDGNSSWVSTLMAYDSNGNLTTVTDPLGRVTRTDFDTTFRSYPVKVTNPLGHTTRVSYDAAGLPISATDANGNVTTATYDPFARKLQEQRPDGGRTDYSYPLTYDAYGRVTGRYERAVVLLDATGRTAFQEDYYDGAGFKYLSKATGNCANYIATQSLKDTTGRPNRTSLPYCDGATIYYSITAFDPAGRVTSVTTPDGKTSTTTYGLGWQLQTDPNGNATRKYFDARGRVTSIVDPAGQTTTYGYDPLGRLTSVTLPTGATTTVAYDSLGRKTRVTDPQLGTTTWAYDAVGNPVTVTAAGKTVTFTYDPLNRVTKKQAGAEAAVSYAYDDPLFSNSKGRLTTLVDASGTTRTGYTNMGQVASTTRVIDGDSYTVGFTYDLAGRATSMSYPDGSLVEYAYTGGGQHAQVKLNGAVMGSWSNFTASGRPQDVSYGNGVATHYGYDLMTHLTSLATAKGTAPPLQDLTYEWYTRPNTGGLNLGSITDGRANKIAADGSNTDETQTFTYDSLYRLTQAVGVWGTKSYAYDAIGNLTRFEGLVNRTMAYNGQQAVSGDGFSATYDGAGNMTHKVLDRSTWDYTWTAENRLATAKKKGVLTAQMAYDAGGQRVKKVYTPAKGPSVTTVYIGNLYEKRTYSNGALPRHTLHLYANGQLVSTVTREGNILTAFNNPTEWRNSWSQMKQYDGASALGAVKKASHFAAAVASHPTVLRWAFPAFFALLALGLMAQLLLAARRLARASRGVYPLRLRLAAAPLVLVFAFTGCSLEPDGKGGARVSTSSYAVIAGDTTNGPAIGTYYYHRNHINSSSVITNASGVEMTRIVYLPYGEISQPNSAGGETVTSKFTGQEYDQETGLYYYGARYYDPAIGRFVSADSVVPSLSDSQAWNRYAYARDNPVVYTDPTGHSFWSWLGDVLSAIGNAIASAFRAIGQALHWLWDKLGDAVRFLGKAATYAWETVKGIASNPLGLALFLMGVAMALAVPGSSLLIVLLKASAPIVATSLARAAGINNPIVLGLIGLAAGLAVNGAGLKDWLKGGAKFAGEKLVRAIGGDGLAAVYSMADFAVSNVPEGSEGGEAPKGEGSGPGTKGGGSTPAATATAPETSPGAFMALESEASAAPADTTYGRASCSFTMGTGRVMCSDIVSGEVFLDSYGYAGVPGATNNPVWQLEQNVGPLPEGEYFIGVPQQFNGMGNSMRLMPDINTDTFGRSGFWTHGPGTPWGTGSQGCLVLGYNDRAAIAARGGGHLQVFGGW